MANPFAAVKVEIERLIEASGIQSTFLRPGMFALNTWLWWAAAIRAGNIVRWPYAEAPTAPIHERDIAAVAALALCEEGHGGGDYVLTGPQSRRELAALMPPAVIGMLLNAWAAGMGQPAFVTPTVADLTGRPARTYRDWVTDHAAEFGP